MAIDIVRILRVLLAVLLICILFGELSPFLGIIDIDTLVTLLQIVGVALLIYYIFLLLYVRTSNAQNKKLNITKKLPSSQILFMAIPPAIGYLVLGSLLLAIVRSI